MQGAIDEALKGSVITASECISLIVAATVLLSMLGVNLAGLVTPAAFACAFAAKDLTHNFLAGVHLCFNAVQRCRSNVLGAACLR